MPAIPTTLISKTIVSGDPVESVNVKVNYTGTIMFDITNNFDDASPTWETLPLVSGELYTHTFTSNNNTVAYRIIGLPGSIIENVYDIALMKITPGIYIKLIYV